MAVRFVPTETVQAQLAAPGWFEPGQDDLQVLHAPNAERANCGTSERHKVNNQQGLWAGARDGSTGEGAGSRAGPFLLWLALTGS